MSNTNTNLKTQTSNALHNAIIEAGGKDRPPMLAPEGSSKTTTEGYMENYKNVSQDIRSQLDAEAEVVQIILAGIDNDIYSTVDACSNACEMWKAIKRLKHGESINVQDLETNLYWEFGKFTSRDGESLESYYSRFVTLVKQSQELKTFSYHKLYDILKQHHNEVNEIRAERLARIQVVHQSRIQCYNFKEYGHIARECQKPKRAKDAAYHKKKMLLCEKEEAGIQLSTEQDNWRDDTNDEPDDQELEAYYLYIEKIQEVTLDVAGNSGPIFDTKPLQKVQNDNDNYNVFANDKEHPEQPESVNDTYLEEQGDANIIIDSLDMSTNGETVDQDDDDLAKERDLLASFIEKLKCEIDDSQNRNKFLESSNETLIDKLKGEIEDFKTKNKSLESSNNHFKEANNELSKTNQLMFKDLKKFQAELDRYHDVNYASKVEIDCANAKGDLVSYKMEA
ncbi:integrase, catalytic region, zinc finger, CCHC-type containing protein [Tanacetum coccineum]